VNRRDNEREHAQKEIRVDLSHFHGKEDLEAYLDCKMKIGQVVECP